MKIAITGAQGFLGWHLACRAFATRGILPARLGRAECSDPLTLAGHISGYDVVVHLAAVNRADTDEEVFNGNVAAARVLGDAIGRNGAPVSVVYANSIQADNDTSYGRGKAEAGHILAGATAAVGGTLANVMLPNLFGEHGRPGYNSFVATFCQQIVDGQDPVVTSDRPVPLLHAQRAAEVLLKACEERPCSVVRPSGTEKQISAVADQLQLLHGLYRSGEIPLLNDAFAVDLFNTYRSLLDPTHFPIATAAHSDQRGQLVELARSHGGTSQSFVSTTEPGQARGNHFHLSKFERFLVVEGEAEIALRRLFDSKIITHRVSGAEPGFVDMPTMWTHNIRNTGSGRLVTAFWADQLLNPDFPDQYPLAVQSEELP